MIHLNKYFSTRRLIHYFVILTIYSLIPQTDIFSQGYHQLTTQQNLTSNQYNWYLHQDTEGYLWASSVAGLNRFDGYRNKQYHADRRDPSSLDSEYGAQSNIEEDVNGDLWFAASTTLTRYNRKTDDFTHFNHVGENGDTLRQDYHFAKITPDEKGLLCSGGRKLFYHPVDNWSAARQVDTIAVGNLTQVIFPDGGERGAFSLVRPKLLRNEIEIRHYADYVLSGQPTKVRAPLTTRFTDATIGKDGVLWIATTTGILRYDLKTDSWLDLNHPDIQKYRFNCIDVTNTGTIIAGAPNHGVFKIHPTIFEVEELFTTSADGLSTSIKLDLTKGYIGKDNTYWMSTANDGIRFTNLNEPKFETKNFSQFPYGSNVIDLALGPDGTLHVLSDSVVFRIGPAQTSISRLPMRLINNGRTRSMAVDSGNETWVATYSGMLVDPESNGNFEEYFYRGAVGPDERAIQFSGVYELSDQQLLILTYTEELFSTKSFNSPLTRWGGAITRANNIALSMNGHALVNTNTDTSYVISTEGPDYSVLATFPKLTVVNESRWDENNKCYWLATYTGIYQIREAAKDEWEIEPRWQDRFRGVSALEISGDHIWCATTSNIRKVNIKTGEITVFTVSDGIQSSEYNFGSSVTLPHGNLAFGGPNGITIIDPKVKSALAPSRALVSEIIIKDTLTLRSNQAKGALELPSDQNKLLFYLYTGEYSDRSAAQFKYSLSTDGEINYNTPSNRPEVLLEQLQPATYYLSIQASNADGVWAKNPYKLVIKIRPPWYQTTLAYTLYTITFLGTLFGILYFRYRQLRKVERAQLQQANAEREAAETETSILRLQMNPHFIFNSLNSIDDYILDREPIEAHDYLVLFAELMRDILNRSTQPLTRLDHEIELLTRYVEAERRRIGEGLRLVIDIPDALDDVSTYLPTMILQPFVENAIWHGIGHRPGGGTVTLRFYEEGPMLIAEVEDDGRGRGMPGEGGKTHKSKALDITRKRLALLSHPNTAPAAAPEKPRYEIHDLKSEAGQPSGTRVVLYLPRIHPEDYASSSN